MATKAGRPPIFLDTNVLIRANVVTAPLHEESLTVIKNLRYSGTDLWISRQILREYTANITREQTFMKPLSAATAVERVRYFESRFHVADENAHVTARLLMLMESIPLGGKQVHDANIVATMLVYGVGHLLTLNTADFTRFSMLISILSLSTLEPWLRNE